MTALQSSSSTGVGWAAAQLHRQPGREGAGCPHSVLCCAAGPALLLLQAQSAQFPEHRHGAWRQSHCNYLLPAPHQRPGYTAITCCLHLTSAPALSLNMSPLVSVCQVTQAYQHYSNWSAAGSGVRAILLSGAGGKVGGSRMPVPSMHITPSRQWLSAFPACFLLLLSFPPSLPAALTKHPTPHTGVLCRW
jgi:hypothetical protein